MCQQSPYLVLPKHLIFIKEMTLQAITKDNPHSQVFIIIETDCGTEMHTLPGSVSRLPAQLGCRLAGSRYLLPVLPSGPPCLPRSTRPHADVHPRRVMPVVSPYELVFST